MEFEMTPGARVTTNRNLALISLHKDFTNYLMNINEKVRPIDLPLMYLDIDLDFSSHSIDGGFLETRSYRLNNGWENQVFNFSRNFKSEYPEIEQVYIFSKWSENKMKIGRDIWGGAKYQYDSVSASISRVLNEIIFKRFLVVDVRGVGKKKYNAAIGYEQSQSTDEEIKKTLERSLRFNSWSLHSCDIRKI